MKVFVLFEKCVEDNKYNDVLGVFNTFDTAKQTKGEPTIIIAKTVKGKGVSFMENKAEWHGQAPTKEQYDEAITELDTNEANEIKETF